MIFVDGEPVESSETIQKLEVSIEPTDHQPLPQPPVNYAVNNGLGFFPHITASSYQPSHFLYYANEGNYWYHKTPTNRWVSESNSEEEWIAVVFGVKWLIDQLKLYFLDDGEEIVPLPLTRFKPGTVIAGKPNSPQTALSIPTGQRPNVITFNEPQQTSKVRILLTPQPGQAVGLTELEAWGPAGFPLDQPTDEIKNLAYNPDAELYPIFSASYTSDSSSLAHVSDMNHLISYKNSPAWTSE